MFNKRTLLLIIGLFIVLGAPEIFAKTISHIGERGFKIKKPGVYSFSKDIKVDLEDGRAAITIEANHVTLDLNQFSLHQEGKGKNNIGILVKPHHNSISIKNGAISNIHGFGIKVEEGNTLIELQDLLITANGKRGAVFIPADNNSHTGGILFLGSNTCPIKDISLIDCRVTKNRSSDPLVAVNGLLMSEVDKISIQNSYFSDNRATSAIAVTGAEFFHSRNSVIKNSSANENSNYPINGQNASAFGFHFNETAGSAIDSTEHFNINIANSTANATSGSVIRAAGFRFRKAKNIIVENSESHQTINTLSDPVDVDPTVTAAAGFIFTICDSFNVRNCMAYGHLTISPSLRIVGGFDIARSNYGVVKGCHAAQCQNLGGGTFAGFITEPALSRPNFERNIGIIFENCVSEANVGSLNGGGFAFFRDDEGKIIECKAIENSPYGIEVGKLPVIPGDDTINSLIEENETFSNSVAGLADTTGNVPPNTGINAYLGNIARDNPINFILPAGNPIVVWSLSTGGTLSAEDTDNIDIR